MNDKDFKWSTELVKEFLRFGICVGQAQEDAINNFIKSKEVSNKDYEIVAYINVPQQLIYVKTATDKFVYEKDSTYQIHEPEKCANLFIYSVKRLSDSEVFTKDEFTGGGNQILGFELINGNMKAHMIDHRNLMQFKTNIQSLTKKETTVIFTEKEQPINLPIKNIAEMLAIWSWGKEIPTEMFMFEKFIKRGLIEIQQKINNNA